MASETSSESRVLDILRQRYEDLGYVFYRHPPPDLLPAFLGSFVPDGIALGPQGNVAIQLSGAKGRQPRSNAGRVAELFRNQPDWKYELVLVDDPAYATEPIEPPSRERVLCEIDEARTLIEQGHARAALVLLWAALEAAVRKVDADFGARPRMPKSLVEFLEREGHVSRETAAELRKLADVRNSIVHGDVERRVDPDSIRAMASSVEALVARRA